MYEFQKLDVPSDAEIKSVLYRKPHESLQQYKNAIEYMHAFQYYYDYITANRLML